MRTIFQEPGDSSRDGALPILHWANRGRLSLSFWWQLWRAKAEITHYKSQCIRLKAPQAGHRQRGEHTFHLLGLGDSVIAGEGVDNLRFGLVASTASMLALPLGTATSWDIAALCGGTAATIGQRVLPGLTDQAPPDAVLISVGLNDVMKLHTLRRWNRELSKLLSDLESRFPGVPMVLLALPDIAQFTSFPLRMRSAFDLRARAFNAETRRLTHRSQQTYFLERYPEFDESIFAADGFHPSTTGCSRLGAVCAAFIAEIVLGVQKKRSAHV